MTGTELLRRLDEKREQIDDARRTRTDLDSLARRYSVFKPVDEAMDEVMRKLYAEQDALEARLAALKEE